MTGQPRGAGGVTLWDSYVHCFASFVHVSSLGKLVSRSKCNSNKVLKIYKEHLMPKKGRLSFIKKMFVLHLS